MAPRSAPDHHSCNPPPEGPVESDARPRTFLPFHVERQEGSPACAVSRPRPGVGRDSRSYGARRGATHEVTNQVPPLVGHDSIAGDAALREAGLRHADEAAFASLTELGALAGSEQAREWGRLADPADLPVRARRVVGLLALCLQGSLLLRHASAEIPDASCASRRGGDRGTVLGTLPAGGPPPSGRAVNGHGCLILRRSTTLG